MTNFEIKEIIHNLQDEFMKVLNDTNNIFELNPRIEELKQEMDTYAAQCTHTNEDGTSAFNENGVCAFCGRHKN